MAIPKSEKIWFNGQFVPWDEAQVHVTAHALHYGSNVFEGIRCYSTTQGPAIFCLDAHVDRLYKSAKIYRTEVPYSPDQMRQAIIDTVRVNQHQSCYIRPLVFRGVGEQVAGKLLDRELIERLVRVERANHIVAVEPNRARRVIGIPC